jgi:hypothetical protein
MLLSQIVLTEAVTVKWNFNDDERSKTLNSLIKYNNGLWKSAKQRDFLTSPKGIMGGEFPNGSQRRDFANLKSFFNVDIDDKKTQYVIDVGGWVSWADYGSKSVKPFTYLFVLDNLGVVKKYKLKYYMPAKGSHQVDTKKTKLEWERPKNVDSSALEKDAKDLEITKATKQKEQEQEAAKMVYLGNPGEWIEDLEVKIENIVDLGAGEWGTKWMTVIKDKNGNLLNYFGFPKEVTNNDDYKNKQYLMRAKVKKHYVNKKGQKVTVVGYPKFKEKK